MNIDANIYMCIYIYISIDIDRYIYTHKPQIPNPCICEFVKLMFDLYYSAMYLPEFLQILLLYLNVKLFNLIIEFGRRPQKL